MTSAEKRSGGSVLISLPSTPSIRKLWLNLRPFSDQKHDDGAGVAENCSGNAPGAQQSSSRLGTSCNPIKSRTLPRGSCHPRPYFVRNRHAYVRAWSRGVDSQKCGACQAVPEEENREAS